MNTSLKLSELLFLVQDVLSDRFTGEEFYVIAETSDIKNYPDRAYCFLTLVEKDGNQTRAKADAVIWSKHYPIIRQFEAAAGIRFEKNIRVLLRVSVDYSPVWGLKLQILGIDASFSLGNIELQRKQIVAELLNRFPGLVKEVDGRLISRNSLLNRPVIFKSIALISAPDSDGLRDFRHELQINEFGYRFHVHEFLCQVQGQGAEQKITDALKQIQKSGKYDAVVIVRGGGAQLDFGPFDTLVLASEVAGFPIPVITGIGHERNVSITDEVAHENLKTPTKAAAFLIHHNRRAEEFAEQLMGNILMKSRQRFVDEDIKLGHTAEKLQMAVERFFRNQHQKLDRFSENIRHLDPAKILARGFAYLRKDTGIVTSAGQLQEGDRVEILLHDGHLEADIITKKTES